MPHPLLIFVYRRFNLAGTSPLFQGLPTPVFSVVGALVAVLLYPLSAGPAMCLIFRTGRVMTWTLWFYGPFEWLVKNGPEAFRNAFKWCVELRS